MGYTLIIDLGANHDSLVLNESELYSHEHLFFKDATGYILGDSAYRLTNRVMKPYSKKEVQDEEEGRYNQFNIHYSSARVNVEHTFGSIKMRFPLMSGLSTVLGSEEGNKRGVEFIFVACILHNFLLTMTDEWIPTAQEITLIGHQEQEAYESVLSSEWHEVIADMQQAKQKKLGELKREWLVETVIEWLINEEKIR